MHVFVKHIDEFGDILLFSITIRASYLFNNLATVSLVMADIPALTLPKEHKFNCHYLDVHLK